MLEVVVPLVGGAGLVLVALVVGLVELPFLGEVGVREAIALLVALVADLADYGVLGLPLVGDVLDIVAGLVLFLVLRNPYVVLGLFELFPGVDVFPTWLGATAYALHKREFD